MVRKLALTLGLVAALAAPVAAEPLRWQLAPDCDALALEFAPVSPHFYAVSGSQDYRDCGLGALFPTKPVVGLAVVEGSEVALFLAVGFTIGLPEQPILLPFEILATIDTETKRGAWRIPGTIVGGTLEPLP